MSVAFRTACNLEAQEQLIADAIASGVRVTVLPEYTPKPRPAHTVKSWKVMDLPKPKPKKPIIDNVQSNHVSKERRKQLLTHLKRVGVLTPAQIREKFGYANPGKTIGRINDDHNRLIISTERVALPNQKRKAIFYRYAG